MESSPESKPYDSLKCSKTPPSEENLKPVLSDPSPWSTQTPEKPADHRRQTRNRRAAFSVAEVREEAARINVSERDRIHNPVGSSGQKIGSGSGDSKPIGKPKKKVDGSVKLPEKYEILGKFFDSLDSSIRLLRLKGSPSTFTNISPKIEYLTERRFSYDHLAQLKFILPEVIEMKKVLVNDERTSCMKPDLHITMHVDAVKNEGKLKSASGNSHMRKVFHSRLLEFFKAHPKGEVPEETLPEPFNKSKLDLHTSTSNAFLSSLNGETSTGALLEQQQAAATHLSHTFRRRFSQQISRYAKENSNQEKGTVSLQPSVLPVTELLVDQTSNEVEVNASTAPSISKLSLKPPTREHCSLLGASQASVQPSHPNSTPLKKRDCLENENSSAGTATIQGTPAKLVSTPVSLMSATPALRPPKRCYMSPDDNSTNSPNKLIRRPLRNRSLKFDSPVKNAEVEDELNHVRGLSVDNDIFDLLPENLLESIKEKERKSLEEKDPAISQAKRRQKMIASLPKLFDMIRFLFQSIKRSVVTKEELMHRIVASHLDVVDRREVEEQLKLLQELAPEWIYEKLACSGDLLICINKMFGLDSMRARLLEAK